MSSAQALPAGFLSNSQLGELNRAYSDEGVQELQTDRKVTYYDAVSYEVLGHVDDKLGRHDAHTSKDDGVVRVKVRVGDMIEFRADFEADGRGFAEVVAVMQHQDRVFLVVSWMERIATFGKYRSTFFSLCLVDHPKFVGGTHFVDVGNGVLVRNDWVFNVV